MSDLSALIAAARSFAGVPFRHYGFDRHGVDCVGLILAAAEEAGLFAYRPPPYSRGDHSRLIAEVERFAVKAAGPPQPGDLLVMRTRNEVTHLALVSERQTIIHAHEKVGRVVEQALTVQVLAQVFVCYRWKGGSI
jgi:murein DD-endopeptidase / murein LD-carboxypeptidase